MKIREALKQERLAQHKTQNEWVKDINISVSHYSEIESGYARNGKQYDIDSEDLLILLKSNNVDVLDFFSKVEKSYVTNPKEIEYQKLSQELTEAFNNANAQQAEKIKKQIEKLPDVNKNKLYYRAVLISADLKDHMVSLSQNMINRIDQVIYQSNNWLEDSEALIIFGNSMPILSKNILIQRMGQILRKYNDIKNMSEIMQRRISTICINYLYNAIFLKGTDKYINSTLLFLQKLPADDIFGMKKLIAQYFKDVLSGDIKHIHELKKLMIRSGLQGIVNKLPI